ncbi:MAG: M36 family metallopeptidase [Verrucomicrobia bacterium]|nr:M36 family metallopeptidase [Verrucomicrobiota bacterium]
MRIWPTFPSLSSRFLLLSAWVAWMGFGAASVLAFHSSESLPPIDRRIPANLGAKEAQALLPSRAAAESHLRDLLPSAQISYDPITGSPAFIRCLDGCLTGPNGAGKGVSLASVNAIPRTQAHRPLRAFLKEHAALFGHGAEILGDLTPSRDDLTARTGLRSISFAQRCQAIPILDAVMIAHITARGELLSLSSTFLADAEAAATRWSPQPAALAGQPPVTSVDAIIAAAENLGETIDASQIVPIDAAPLGAEQRREFKVGRFPGNTRCQLRWTPINPSTMTLCWQVELTRTQGGERYQVFIDARTRDTLIRRCLTVYEQPITLNVFTHDSPSPFSPGFAKPSAQQPPTAPRTLVTWTALDAHASPLGWIADGENETRGNNVQAALDLNADDFPDLPRPQGFPFRVFSPPLDLSLPADQNQDAAVVQLFYWCNWMHDRLYQLGFTESAGNFQKDNLGRGGQDGDPVIADAQDGSGVNNANFTPAPDGEPGRIQMYVFDGVDPTRDGDLDAEIILHEYTHGLSTRLVGGGVGLTTLQAGGLGEGWSDFYALSLLSESGDDPNACYAMGGYVTRGFFGLEENYYFGIRRYPYTTDLSKNPLTFKDIDPGQATSHPSAPRNPVFPFSSALASEVHNQGEVWCVTLWEARAALIRKHGWETGNELMLRIVTDGMKLTPPNPNFLQARDGILQADLVANGGANLGELWTAFARRGMGFSARSPVSSTTSGVREARDLPDALALDRVNGFVFTGPVGGPFFTGCQTLRVTNTQSGPVRWTLSNTAEWLSAEPSEGLLPPESAVDIQLCLAAPALDLNRGRYLAELTVTNLESGVAQSRSVDLRALQFTTMPFADDFEEKELRPEWLVANPPFGRVQITSLGGPHGGDTHLTFDSNSEGLPARNELTVGLDMRGWTNVVLRFWAKEFNDEPNPPPPSPFLDGADFDGVSISVDGSLWYEAQSLRELSSTNRELVVRLDETVARYALHYNERFQIRFTQFDNYPIPVDGIAIDDVSVTGTPAGRFHLELPDVVREGAADASLGKIVLSIPASRDVTFLLSTAEPTEIDIPGSAIVRAGQSAAQFAIRARDNPVLDGTRRAHISAQAQGYFGDPGVLMVGDDETARMTLTLPPQVTEASGLLMNAGHLEIDQPAARNIQVTLRSSAADKLSVPDFVVVPAGAQGVDFDLMLLKDKELTGPIQLKVSAEVSGWETNAATTLYIDIDPAALSLSLPGITSEGNPPVTATVLLSGTVKTNVVVTLTPETPDSLLAPAQIILLAGQSGATFKISAVDNSIAEGGRDVALRAEAIGFVAGRAFIHLLDDETPPAPYGPTPSDTATNQSPKLELRWHAGLGDILVNGDFESGDFRGWQRASESAVGWVINDGTVNPDGPDIPAPAFEGDFSALVSQDAPGRHELFQDVAIPPDAKSATLSWFHFIHNHGPEYFNPSQQFRVEILNDDGVVQETAFATQPGDPLSVEWTRVEHDLTRHRGETLRIRFVEDDALGYINVGLDNVKLELSGTGRTDFEVYLSRDPDIHAKDLAGLSPTNTFTVSGLPPSTDFYWQVVAVKAGVRTAGPVWRFQTRGVGDMDHFEWSDTPGLIRSGEPFHATLTARDVFGFVATNFSGVARLRAQAGDGNTDTVLITEVDPGKDDQVELGNVSSGPADVSGWQVVFYDLDRWPKPKATFVIPRDTILAPGGTCVIREGGKAPGAFPLFQLGQSVGWGFLLIGQPVAVALLDPATNLVDVVCAVDADPSAITLPVPIPPQAWTGVPLAPITQQSNTWQRVGDRDRNSNRDWIVADRSMGKANTGLALPFKASNAFDLAPTSVADFVQGAWSGSLAIQGSAPAITLRADDGARHAGASSPIGLVALDDIALSRVGRPAFSLIDQRFTLSYVISNSGPSIAQGVSLLDAFPLGISLESASVPDGSAEISPRQVLCHLPSLAAGASARVALTFSGNDPGAYTNRAELILPALDSFAGNNVAEDALDILLPMLVTPDVSISEGNTGTNFANFRIRLSGAIQREVRAHYETVDDGATAGLDYIPVSGDIVFAPGVTNLTISVGVIGDSIYEINERFLLRLSSPVNATLGDAEGKASIRDDESPPQVVIESVRVMEGSHGSLGIAEVPVRLTSQNSQPVTMTYFTSDISAVAPADYISQRGQLRFDIGVTQQVIRIPIVGDDRPEGNEAFSVNLTAVSGASVGAANATVLIVDDDQAQLNGLSWANVGATQSVNQPFPVQLAAIDGAGQPVAAFSERVFLRAFRSARAAGPIGESNAWAYPLRTFFHDARCQFLYLTNDLGAAGRISRISLPVQAVPGQTLERFALRLKHVNETSLAHGEWDSSDWTTVYSGDLTIHDPGLVPIPMQTTFAYDGARSILVDWSFNNSSYSSDGRTSYVLTEDLRARVFETDSAFGSPLDWVGAYPPATLTNRVPELRFWIEDDVPVEPTEAGPFAGGVWRGVVRVSNEADAVTLAARSESGMEAMSEPFSTLAQVGGGPAPQILGLSLRDLDLIVEFRGVEDHRYQVEASEDLGKTVWTRVGAIVNGSPGGTSVVVVDVAGAGRPHRFYRVREVQ